MSVYVDTLIIWPGAKPPFHKGSCHMTADSLEELHEMADKIGMKRAWFQNHQKMDHYDLTPKRRILAISFGAIEESCTDGARRRRAMRVKEKL